MISLLRKICQRWNDVRRRYGLGPACRLLADRIGKKLVRLQVSECHWIDKPWGSSNADPAWTCGFLTFAEIERFHRDPRNLLAAEFVEQAREHGDLCFAVTVDGRLANYAWFALQGIEQGVCAPVSMAMPPNVAYMYNAFTHPDFRGRRIHGIATDLALRALSAFGISKLVLLVDWVNEPSLRSYRRLGSRRIGHLASIRLGGRKFFFLPGAARKLGVRISSDGSAQAHAVPGPANVYAAEETITAPVWNDGNCTVES